MPDDHDRDLEVLCRQYAESPCDFLALEIADVVATGPALVLADVGFELMRRPPVGAHDIAAAAVRALAKRASGPGVASATPKRPAKAKASGGAP